MAPWMPPSWTSICALDRRRSEPARCSEAPVSGNSTKAAIEMRGTGRSCGAAPNDSSFSNTFDFTMTAPELLADVRYCAGLVGRLRRRRRLAVLVVVVDDSAARGIARRHRLRLDQIARVGNLRGHIVLHGAPEVRADTIGPGVGEAGRPVAARCRRRAIADEAQLDATIASALARGHDDAVARHARRRHALAEIGDGGRGIGTCGHRDGNRAIAVRN